MITVSTYDYLLKYQVKQKHLLPFHITNDELAIKIKMNNNIKDEDIKSCIYYFFSVIINIKNVDPNKIKIDEKSYNNIFIYYIEYVTIKDSKFVKIKSVNPLYLIINRINGYFEKIRENKHLARVLTDESKEIIEKYEELWSKVGDLIR